MSDPPTQPTPGQGLYVFCVTRDGAAIPSEEGLTQDARLTLLRREGLSAVVCTVELSEWIGADAETHLRDLEWLGPRAVRHERIIEQVMQTGPVLPLRFGCIFSSEASVAEWLSRWSQEIARFLDEISGKQEWSIKGWLHAERATAALAAEDPRIQALPTSPGLRYLREQKIRQELQRTVRTWGRSAGQEILESLRSRGVHERSHMLNALPGSASGRDEEVVFHQALLLAPERVAALHEEVERINHELSARGLTVAVTGPWPPYSFCPSLTEPEEPAQGPDDGNS